MDWTRAEDDLIKGLSAEGLKPKAILPELLRVRPGTTKNSLVGRLHRLGISGENPVQRKPEDVRARFILLWNRGLLPGEIRKRTDVGDPAGYAAGIPECVDRNRRPLPAGACLPVPTATVDIARVVVARVAPPQPKPPGPVRECCWPIGDPGGPRFRFCCEPADEKRPYCAEHAKVAYVKHPERNTA